MKNLFGLLAFFLSAHFAFAQTDTVATKSLKQTILQETREGGKLDFFTPIKGHEYDGIQIAPGVFDTKSGMALMKWGKATRDLGVKSLDEAYVLFSEFKGREVNPREKEYIRIGYNREL